MSESKDSELDELERVHGYRPDESRENWTIFRNNMIVANADSPPKLFTPGCKGIFDIITPD